jgi:cyclophilin family peptidyl-prolyl cis-trans isomerase
MRKPFTRSAPLSLPSRLDKAADGFTFEQLEKREVFDVTINDALNDVVQNSAGSVFSVSLLGRYTDNGVTQVVRMVTNYGNIDISLRGDWAPNTVANFLTYVSEHLYDNTIFHRSQRPTPSVNFGLIQGGGFRPPTTDYSVPPSTVTETNAPALIPTGTTPGTVHDPINLEHPTGNTPYTIGLARTTQPNTGTSQFFINVTDNSGVFDAAGASAGYATFGNVLPFTRGTVNTINNFTYYNAGSPSGPFNSALSNLPLNLHTGAGTAGDPFVVTPADYMTISSATLLSDLTGVETVAWSASVTGNPTLVSVSVQNGSLLVTPNTAGTRGTATIRLRATSADGTTFSDDSFTFEIDNFAPVIGGMQAQSNIAVGGSMLLSAYGVHDTDGGGLGGIASVEFWADTNNNNILDEEDTLLGSDDAAAGGWSSRVSTAGLSAGENRIFTHVIDTDGATVDTSRIVTLRDAVPDSGVTPETTSTPGGVDVNLGFDMNLPDTSGIRRISIFLDTNHDGELDPLTDRRIGFATYDTGTSSWGFTVNASDLQVGANRVFARVTDNYGNLGGITSSSITVES